MRNRCILLTVILCVIIIFTGCTSGNEMEYNNAPAIDTPGNKELSDLETIEEYIDTIGGCDQEIINILGDGKATVSDDMNAVELRRYNTYLFGEPLSMVTSLDDGTIMDMSITPESGTYEEWFNRISETLGKPDEKIEAYQGDIQRVQASAWNLDNGSLTLQSACGTVLVRMNGRTKK